MTAQMAEELLYQGEELSLCTEPLAQYFELVGIEPPRGGCSALWRGYVGSWEITADRLYLLGLSNPYPSYPFTENPDPSLETWFPGFPERVFAHWYSGTLRVPRGKLLEYEHMGYLSTYEQDLFISIEQGGRNRNRSQAESCARRSR